MRFLKKVTRDNRNIVVDISDEECNKFGFSHMDVAINPNNNEVIIWGVGPGNDGEDVLYYELIHPTSKGRVNYWNGVKNLLEAGFVYLRKFV